MDVSCQYILRNGLWRPWSQVVLAYPLLWSHNGRDGISNHQPHDCFLNYSFRRRSKKTSKLRVPGLCAGNSPVTDELPALMASNAEMFPLDDVIMFDGLSGICDIGGVSKITDDICGSFWSIMLSLSQRDIFWSKNQDRSMESVKSSGYIFVD